MLESNHCRHVLTHSRGGGASAAQGLECSNLTEEINKQLGEVYETKPTAEMFEQKIENSVELEERNYASDSWSGDSGGSGGGEW
jgi:hypothetical protein